MVLITSMFESRHFTLKSESLDSPKREKEDLAIESPFLLGGGWQGRLLEEWEPVRCSRAPPAGGHLLSR